MEEYKNPEPQNEDSKHQKKKISLATWAVLWSLALILQWCPHLPITVVNNSRALEPKQAPITKLQNDSPKEQQINKKWETIRKLENQLQEATNINDINAIQKQLNFHYDTLRILTEVNSISEDKTMGWINISFDDNPRFEPRADLGYKEKMNAFKRHGISYRYSKYKNLKFKNKKDLDQLDRVHYWYSSNSFDWYLKNNTETILDFEFDWSTERFSFTLQNNQLTIIHLQTWERKIINVENRNRWSNNHKRRWYHKPKKIGVTFKLYKKEIFIPISL